MAACRTSLLLVHLVFAVSAWENLPAIPAGRRAEYFLLQDDGGYKYGYDTGEGESAVVHADPANQVQGSYSYRDEAGQQVSLAYTAGQGGFMPVQDGRQAGGASGVPVAPRSGDTFVDADYDANADASYNFDIDTDSYKRSESSDARGNIRGQYSYNSREGGSQSLSYIAGEGTGFVVTGGTAGIHGGTGATGGAYSAPRAAPYAGPGANTKSNTSPDGSYSFSFGTSDQSREESADAQNNVRGSYSFRAKDDGQTRRVDYQAGAATGFVASGAHLPVSPATNSAQSRPAAGPVSVYGAGIPSAGGSPHGAVKPDGSYSFSFGTADQTREESADAQNNVRGSYSFRAKDDGQTRRVDYQAGAATGFLASGAHLPVAPIEGSPVPYAGPYSAGFQSAGGQDEGPSGDASYSYGFDLADQSRKEASDSQGNVRGSFGFVAPDGVHRKVDYEAGAEKGFIAKGAHLPVAPDGLSGGGLASGYLDPVNSYSAGAGSVPADSAINPDGSYSFSYNTADQSRQESADAQNNVRGSFSFKAPDDGQTRRVDYEAGAATGFLARGAHLPVPPPVPGFAPGFSYGGSAGVLPSARGSAVGPSQAAVNPDGSYSFSYNTADQSRQESADTQNNVRGSFSFKAPDDGQTRRVDYEAGAATGFIATGAHLPVAPAVPSGAAQLGYSAPSYNSATSYSASGNSAGPAADGSYSFSYNGDESSRQESGDAQGKVRGSFSFVAKDDGQTRRVDYEAGPETGFIAKGAHLPVPVSPLAPVPAGGYSAPVSGHSTKALHLHTPGFALHKYLPPNSPHKFGYVFDTKV